LYDLRGEEGQTSTDENIAKSKAGLLKLAPRCGAREGAGPSKALKMTFQPLVSSFLSSCAFQPEGLDFALENKTWTVVIIVVVIAATLYIYRTSNTP
jgi:hypothetical protein